MTVLMLITLLRDTHSVIVCYMTPLALRLPWRVSWSRVLLRYTTRSIRLNSTTAALSPIPIVESPTFEEFQANIVTSNAPCLLRSCIAHWPALTHWTDLSYLKGSEAGAKLVPVEVARIETGEAVAQGYNSKDTPGSSWDRIEMPLDVFLDALVREADAGDIETTRWAAYLAQYALLDEVCAASAQSMEGQKLIGMAGALAAKRRVAAAQVREGGPWRRVADEHVDRHRGDVHADPQGPVPQPIQPECVPQHHTAVVRELMMSAVVGRKRVCVYPTSAAEDLYLATDALQRNTSLVPSPAPDAARFPRFARAQAAGWTADVAPGEVLFIPRGFFHSVQGLTTSVSVNSWFL